MNIEEFVSHHYNQWDLENWEKIKARIKSDTTYCLAEHRDERLESLLRQAREQWDLEDGIHKELYQRALAEMIQNAKKGWKWLQNRDVEKNEKPNYHVYYTWKIYNENGKEMGSNVHMTESIQKSGLWERRDHDETYFEWVFTGE